MEHKAVAQKYCKQFSKVPKTNCFPLQTVILIDSQQGKREQF